MQIKNLSAPEQAATGFTHVIRMTFADFTVAATSQTYTPVALVNGQFGARTAYVLRTAFSGGSTTGLTLSVGDNGSATRYTAASQLWGAATPVTHVATGTVQAYTAADNIKLTFTGTGANVNTITAGVVDVYVQVVQPGGVDAFAS